MKYTCLLILATALGCRGCLRSEHVFRSTEYKKRDAGINAAIKVAIDDVEKAFANAGLSQKLNPFRFENLPKYAEYVTQVDQLLVRDGGQIYIVKRVRRYDPGLGPNRASTDAEVKISRELGGWKRQLLKSGEFDKLWKECTPTILSLPIEYFNYIISHSGHWFYAKAY